MKAAPRGRRGGDPFVVGARSLPAWDRTGGKQIDLTPLAGRHAAVAGHAAARLLGTKSESIAAFCKAGVIREGRIVEHDYGADRTTHVCASMNSWSHLYLEPREKILELSVGQPASWSMVDGVPDVEKRTCLRVRRVGGAGRDDLIIRTDRRTYRIALIDHPYKVTIGCSWVYPDQPKPLTSAGESIRQSAQRAGSERTSRFAIFELGRSIRDLVERWGHEQDTTKTWQLLRYRAIRRLASIPSTDPVPSAIVDAVVARMLEVGTVHSDEARQWLEIGPGTHFDDLLGRRAEQHRRNRLPLPGNAAPSLDDIAVAFPLLAKLAGTCFDENDPASAPTPRALKIVWNMKGLSGTAAIFAVVAPAYFLHAQRVTEALQRLATLERVTLAAGIEVDVEDETSLDLAIEHVLTSGDLDQVTDLVRHQIAYSLLLVVRILRRRMRTKALDQIAGIAPAHPSRRIVTLLSRWNDRIVEDGRASRKRRVLRYAGHLADLEMAADLNLEQLAMTTKALRAAEPLLGDEDWIDVDVPTTIVDHRGRLVPGKQQLTWRIWNHAAFLGKLAARSSIPHEVKSLRQDMEKYAADPQPPVHEFRSMKGLLGSQPIEPYFVRCWRYGLTARSARLPRRTAHKRRMILRELKLPGSLPYSRARLLHGDEQEMGLWRTALRQNRIVACLAPFEHALRFAHFGLSSTTENLSRTGAWLQQVQDRSGWATRRLRETDVLGFLAHDKGSHRDGDAVEPTWFPVANSHFAEGMELVRMTCERCGYADGLLPEIMHIDALRPKQPAPGAWMFSFDGSVLSPSLLNGFLRYLLPGFERLTFHDFRHLGANAMLHDGAPGWKVKLTLNHASQRLWEYYAMQSKRQEEAYAEEHRQRRLERFADLRALAEHAR